MKIFRILILTFFVYTLISCGGAEERKAVYLEKAKGSIAVGDLDKARIELKNVLQIDPKDGDAYFQLGKIYEQQKEYGKAYGNYLKAEDLKPELLQNHARLGRFYLLLMNDADKAQEKIDLILLKEPDNSDGLLLKAALMLRSKNTDEARKIAQKIVAQDPAHVETVSFLAVLYIKDKNYKDAINLLDAALKTDQNNEQLNSLLVNVLVINKDYDRAEIIYKEFQERNPDSSISYNNLANFYNKTGDKVKAEETLRASIDNDPVDEARVLTLIKYIRATKGDDEAIKELKSFIAVNNRLGNIRLALAELLTLNDDKQPAVKVFKEIINDFSEEATGVTARTALASLYMKEKDYDKASEVVEEAILISPNDPRINFLRAKIAVGDKDLEKAIISLRIVTKEMPENIGAFLLLVSVYELEGNKEQANDTLNNAYEMNKTNADALLNLAKFNLKRNINQAEKIIDDYNNIKGINYDGLSIKAAILNQNKNQSEAYEIAKTLLENYPDKPNGYLQALSYYNYKGNKQKAISVLEEGYINSKDNRKILMLLTSLQVADKQFNVAINRLETELKASPGDVDLKLLLAKVYMVGKDIDSAEALLVEIVDDKSVLKEPYLLLSNIYQNKKDLNAVESVLIKGKENSVSNVEIPLRLAIIYESNKNYKKAIDVYLEAHKSFPDNLIVINNLASMLSDHSDSKDDLDFAKTLALKLKESGQPVFLDTIGWVYYKNGEYSKAIEYLLQTVEKSPSINVFNYHLGMAYKKDGDVAMAKTYLEKSLADNKPFKERSLAEAALKDL